MQKSECRLTVYFENPFWVGVYERRENSRLTVCRIVFGTQPKDYDVYQFLLQNWSRLQFSPPVSGDRRYDKRVNPKRMQRDIQKQLSQNGVGTHAQQALKLQQQEGKKCVKYSRAASGNRKKRNAMPKNSSRKSKSIGAIEAIIVFMLLS